MALDDGWRFTPEQRERLATFLTKRLGISPDWLKDHLLDLEWEALEFRAQYLADRRELSRGERMTRHEQLREVARLSRELRELFDNFGEPAREALHQAYVELDPRQRDDADRVSLSPRFLSTLLLHMVAARRAAEPPPARGKLGGERPQRVVEAFVAALAYRYQALAGKRPTRVIDARDRNRRSAFVDFVEIIIQSTGVAAAVPEKVVKAVVALMDETGYRAEELSALQDIKRRVGSPGFEPVMVERLLKHVPEPPTEDFKRVRGSLLMTVHDRSLSAAEKLSRVRKAMDGIPDLEEQAKRGRVLSRMAQYPDVSVSRS